MIRRRWKLATAVGAAVTVAVLGVVAAADWTRAGPAAGENQAQSQPQDATEAPELAQLAEARELALRATEASLSAPQLAVLLAVESIETVDDFRSRRALALAMDAWATAPIVPIGEPIEHAGRVTAVAIDLSGRLFATASGSDVQVTDTLTGEPIGVPLPQRGKVTDLAFSPDGQFLAVGLESDGVTLSDGATFALIRELPAGDVNVVRFSPDGLLLASFGTDVRLWNPHSGQPVGPAVPVRSGGGTAMAAAFAPDGTWLAVATEDSKRWGPMFVSLLDVPTLQQRTQPLLPSGLVRAIEISPDGRILAIATASSNAYGATFGRVELWDVGNGTSGQLLGERDAFARDVSFTHDGAGLVVGGDGLELWTLAGGVPAGEPPDLLAPAWKVAVSGDDRWMVSTAGDRTERWLVGAEGRSMVVELSGSRVPVNSTIFDPAGKWIATSGDRLLLWQFEDAGSPGEPISVPIKDPTLSLATSPDGRWLAAITPDDVRLVDFNGSTQFPPVLGAKNSWKSLVFTADGTKLALVGESSVEIWDVHERKPLTETALPGDPRMVFLSDDGKLVVASVEDQDLVLRDASSGTPLATLTLDGDLERLMLTAAGGQLAFETETGTRVWDWDAGDPSGVAIVESRDFVLGARVSPVGMAVSSNGRWMAIASNDSRWELRDIETGKTLHGPARLDGAVASSVAFSPDGKWIAVGGWRALVHLWRNPVDVAGACALMLEYPLPDAERELGPGSSWACDANVGSLSSE